MYPFHWVFESSRQYGDSKTMDRNTKLGIPSVPHSYLVPSLRPPYFTFSQMSVAATLTLLEGGAGV